MKRGPLLTNLEKVTKFKTQGYLQNSNFCFDCSQKSRNVQPGIK